MDRLELIAEARLYGRKTPTAMITGSIDPAIERRVAALGQPVSQKVAARPCRSGLDSQRTAAALATH
jgi:hypothetical protein